MKFVSTSILVLACLLILSAEGNSVDLEQFARLETMIDSAKILEANIFAPKVWKKSQEEFSKARRSIRAGKSQKDIDKNVGRATEYVENAIRTTEVSKLTLSEYLAPRDNAKKARAPIHVAKVYIKAEEQFVKATAKVESGDVKGALKEAEKSSALFNTAEMQAIEVEILGKADRLIKRALADEAGKYALSTLDKAKTARSKSMAILRRDRYNRTESVDEANRAEYEAMHAANIAMSVRSLNRNDQAWEKLMLLYEIQMNRVGQSMGLDFLKFDNGPLAAADAMIGKITTLQEANENLSKDSEFLSGAVVQQLQSILAAIDEPYDGNDPVAMGKAVEKALVMMKAEYATTVQELQASQDKLVALEASHQEVESALATRVEKEEKFKKAKRMLNPSEGEILFNSSNDVVLRLSGISFDVGQSAIKDEHIGLLEKVKEIIQLFPYTQLVVEGHTDASGDPASNILLSEKRAYAVTQYIRQSLLIPADQIKSMGFGMDRPVASNQSAEGRARNRRIDVIIQQ